MVKQKILRKNVHLTDFQSRKLQELSEFDGLDPAEHAKRAIDEYLKNKRTNSVLPGEKDVYAELRDRFEDPKQKGAYWLSGIAGKYEFSALLLSSGTKTGIDKGKISKLSIWDPVLRKKTNNFIGSCIVNYDRGWDIRPSRIAEPYYNKVRSLIDHSAP